MRDLSIVRFPLAHPLGGALVRFTAALAALAPLSATALPRPDGAEAVEKTDRLIIKYRNAIGVAAPSADTTIGARVAGNRRGLAVAHHRRLGNGAHVFGVGRRLAIDELKAMADELKATDANVEYAEPDRILQPALVPGDPLYAQQWSLYDSAGGINAPAAWDVSTGAGVTVAVVDTGVRPHVDLQANLLPGYDFITHTVVANDGDSRDADASDPGDATAAGFCYSGSPASNSSWHGTHVAGTIAAATNNDAGVAGVAFGAKLVPVRVLGRCGGYTSDIADAVAWASGAAVSGAPANAYPARVINLSLGGGGGCGTTMQDAINVARSRGTLVVAAAGNGSTNAGSFTPANCAGVVAVAAVGKSGGKATYSNYGAIVDLAAPGGDGSWKVLSTLNTGATAPGTDSYAGYMGTSMATPHVSGVAALVLAKLPALTPDELEARLKASAHAFPASCNGCGSGIVDAAAALAWNPGAPPPPPPAKVAEVEPNNSIAAAQTVPAVPALVEGKIASGSDTDYYKVGVPAGGRLTATLTPGPRDNFDLYIYDAAGRLMAFSNQGKGLVDKATVSNSGGAAVFAYVRVMRAKGDGPYTLGFAH